MNQLARLLCLVSIAAAALTAAAARPALAQVSIDGGVFAVNGTTDLGGLVSLQIFKTPVLPLAVEVTGAKPFAASGFAATGDARFTVGGTTFGGGIGFGDLASSGSYAGLYDILLAQKLIPHLAIEARMWMGERRPASAFIGLRASL